MENRQLRQKRKVIAVVIHLTFADEMSPFADELHYGLSDACSDETGYDAHCGENWDGAVGGNCQSQTPAYESRCQNRMPSLLESVRLLCRRRKMNHRRRRSRWNGKGRQNSDGKQRRQMTMPHQIGHTAYVFSRHSAPRMLLTPAHHCSTLTSIPPRQPH